MIVFLHGVPETAAIWDGVRELLDDDSRALSLPGFATPRPAGFGATKDEYVEWLVEELVRSGPPVDLVGHDWGAALTYRVATTRGDLLRSWTTDIVNAVHPAYVWHDVARVWQTPGEGEALFESLGAVDIDQRASLFEAVGVPSRDAPAMVGRIDAVMASCILDLYRSATPNPAAHWGPPPGPTSAPGLVLIPSEDPYGDEGLARDVAATLGARCEVLEGLGHWWMLQSPERAAAAVSAFVHSLD